MTLRRAWRCPLFAPLLASLCLAAAARASYTFYTVDGPNAGIFGTNLTGINDSGVISGFTYTKTGSFVAFTYSGYTATGHYADGTFNPVTPGSGTGTRDDTAYGISNNGSVVGTTTSQGVTSYSYIGGNFAYFNEPGASTTEARGINNSGTIVGSTLGPQGFSYSQGTFTPIVAPNSPGNVPVSITSVNAINDGGTIVVSDTDANENNFSYLYQNGSFTTITIPGALDVRALGIDDKGDIVGQYDGTSGTLAFLLAGGVGGILTPLADPLGRGTIAASINDEGVIVGEYFVGETGHGFIAVPNAVVPEPSSLALTGAGVAGLTLRARRRLQHHRHD